MERENSSVDTENNIQMKTIKKIELTDSVKDILGRPNFWCGSIARLMRDVGYAKIKSKSEDEQAVVIHWLLSLYLEFGEIWKEKAEQQMNTWIDELKSKTTPKPKDDQGEGV